MPMKAKLDSWQLLQREITTELKSYQSPTGCKLSVYLLFPYSIIIFDKPDRHLTLKKSTQWSNGVPEIIITCNQWQDERIALADSNRGSVIERGKALTLQEFCVWLFDRVCQHSSPIAST